MCIANFQLSQEAIQWSELIKQVDFLKKKKICSFTIKVQARFVNLYF